MSDVVVIKQPEPVKVVAQSTPKIKVVIVQRGPKGRDGNDATFVGDVDLGTFN